ncbi:Hint domain-containing protein [Nitrosomonas sp. Is37]|uniref:Hint domain-containing protein n=1 Tax=Nitrosomonas sp. Is37 TaxID=3080535 RepID=UPI00294AAAEF|nr:Hint domain-containing protein [Nitrosomonas sp. Is37]MDV6344201.1 Hint domain-containing protein [Nitrosomonas sp. Is37]
MANTTFSNIIIGNVAGNDGKIDQNEASSTFAIEGSGIYSSTAPSVGQTIQVKITWFDAAHPGGIEQTINAIVKTVLGGSSKTFTWSIDENNFAGTTVGQQLALGADSVKVTFPQSIDNNGTPSGSADSNTFNFTYACFLRGTRVLTRYGYCPVEELAIGDEVRTLNGGWQSLRWVGHQRIATLFGLAKGAPVRITAGAFGPGLPERDVFVSQEHAIFFRNYLIPAKSLINGVTVFRDTTVEDIEYFHLLLDRHDVIFSEGLATESYVPCENIDWFDNTSECPEALLNAIRAGTAECLSECYPRQANGPVVEAARALLARFAPANVKDRAVG